MPDEVAERVLDRFTEVGLVDDAAFAGLGRVPARGPRSGSAGARPTSCGTAGVDQAAIDAALEDLDREHEAGDGAAARRQAAARDSRARPRAARFAPAGRDARPQGLPAGRRLAVVREALAARAIGDAGRVDVPARPDGQPSEPRRRRAVACARCSRTPASAAAGSAPDREPGRVAAAPASASTVGRRVGDDGEHVVDVPRLACRRTRSRSCCTARCGSTTPEPGQAGLLADLAPRRLGQLLAALDVPVDEAPARPLVVADQEDVPAGRVEDDGAGQQVRASRAAHSPERTCRPARARTLVARHEQPSRPRRPHLRGRTYGCQMNVHDSERLTGLLEDAGYVARRRRRARPTSSSSTPARCGRTPTTSSTATSATCAPVKDARPGMQIAVGGCLAQKDRGEIVRRAPWVDVVFGTHNIGSLPVLLERARRQRGGAGRDPRVARGLPVDAADPARVGVRRLGVDLASAATTPARSASCPALRGKEKDRRPGDILAEVEALVAEGVIEVTLLGQNVNAYGVEFGDRQAFAQAAARLRRDRGAGAGALHLAAPARTSPTT